MNKYFLLLAALPLLMACGDEEPDIDSYDFPSYYNYNTSVYTKPGGATNITSTSADIGILRQTVDKTEWLVVVEASKWSSNSYSLSNSDCAAIVEIPSKTDTKVTVTGLTPSTSYYCFQTSDSPTLWNYTSQVGSKYITFTTQARKATISSVKKLGLHSVIIYADADKLCYSSTNSTPTTSDFSWDVANGRVEVNDLVANRTYYVRPYADGNYGTVTTITTRSTDTYATAVDLGLSVKWADRMLLAESPLPALSNYCFLFGGTYIYRYYNESYSSGSYSKQDVDAAHDAATYHWGTKWRTPTKEEAEELNQLTMVYTRQDGVDGLLVKGRWAYANNSIFISMKRFWTSTLHYTSSSYTDGFDFWPSSSDENITVSGWQDAYKTRYIIPVQDK